MLAKTQNLFKTDEEFTPVEFVAKEQTAASRPAFGSEEPEFFVLASKVWEMIQSDKEFAAELDKVIAIEVEKRIVSVEKARLAACEVTIAQRMVEKENEGFEVGLKRAEIEVEKAKAELIKEVEIVKLDLRQQIQNVISEKQRILDEHQRVWLKALSTILKKFLVQNAGRIEAGIHHWLETQVSNFSAVEKLNIFVPEAEYLRLEKMAFSKNFSEFEILKDSKLNSGEFRIESKSGGVFFSAEQEMKKLDDLLVEMGCLEEATLA